MKLQNLLMISFITINLNTFSMYLLIPGNQELLEAVEANDIDGMNTALDQGADINVQNFCDYTPLFIAAMQLNIPIIEALIRRGANVNISSGGLTPLEISIQESIYFGGQTPLNQRFQCAQILLAADANIDIFNIENWTTFLTILIDHGLLFEFFNSISQNKDFCTKKATEILDEIEKYLPEENPQEINKKQMLIQALEELIEQLTHTYLLK